MCIRDRVKIDIVSYDDFDLDCLVKDGMLKKGSNISKVYGNSKYVLAVWDKAVSYTHLDVYKRQLVRHPCQYIMYLLTVFPGIVQIRHAVQIVHMEPLLL